MDTLSRDTWWYHHGGHGGSFFSWNNISMFCNIFYYNHTVIVSMNMSYNFPFFTCVCQQALQIVSAPFFDIVKKMS